MLRSERTSWSNITGLEPVPPKDDIPPPAHYMWIKEDGWYLDTTGPWIDDILDIGIVYCIFIYFAMPLIL